MNSASQTPHHRSDCDPREDEDTAVDSEDDEEFREREPPPGCPARADGSIDGDSPRPGERPPWEERRLRSARGPAAEPVRSEDPNLRCDWCRSSCRCLPEASGVDAIDRRESAEEADASDSPPPREESREEQWFSEPEREERLPRPSWGEPAALFELRLLRRLEVDCCFSHCCRSGAESGMLTRAWAKAVCVRQRGERTIFVNKLKVVSV